MRAFSKKERGVTLIELMISSALVIILFAAVFFGTEIGLRSLNQHKHRSEAITIIQRELEDLKRLNFYQLKVEIDDISSGEKRLTTNVRWRVYDNEYLSAGSYEEPGGSGIFYTQEVMTTQISDM